MASAARELAKPGINAVDQLFVASIADGNVTCHFCKQQGHIRPECPLWIDALRTVPQALAKMNPGSGTGPAPGAGSRGRGGQNQGPPRGNRRRSGNQRSAPSINNIRVSGACDSDGSENC
jgi:hypothetical protein